MKLRFLLFFILIYSNTFAQKPIEVNLIMIEGDNIASVNSDEDTMLKSLSDAIELFKKEFHDISSSQKIALMMTYHKEGKATLELYANPKLKSDVEKEFIQKVNDLKQVNTKIVDFTVMLVVNSKDEKIAEDFPNVLHPKEKMKKAYEEANLNTKLELNKSWAINEALPVLYAFETTVDDKFVGVKNFGKLVAKTDFNKKQDIGNLTSTNSDYWRALMEMEKGNQLIPVTKIAMLFSQGELDYAFKYIEILGVFSNPETVSDSYLKEMSWRLKTFNNQLNDQIAKGIEQHDSENFDKAIGIYSSILKEYPNSAWTQYEKYYSQNALELKNGQNKADDRKLWDASKINIYISNPLYNMDVRANNGSEGYLLFRRQEIGGLFKTKGQLIKDIYKYADIAMDLKVYDFAAQFFWMTANYDKDETNSLTCYLYCLEKLGVKNLKENFKGDHQKEFKELEASKEKIMKESSIYNSFKN